MRTLFTALLLVSVSACSSSPTRPSASPTPKPEPHIAGQVVYVRGTEFFETQHHNITATLEDGSTVWMCETQPRVYSTREGKTFPAEVDHYIQKTECPAEPIE